MIAELSAAISGIKSLKDISKAILDMKVDDAVRAKAVELNFAIIDLQSTIFDLQTQHQSLLDEKDALKKQLMNKEKWQAEASRYSLKEIDPGIYVYLLDKDKAASEPVHWLCIKCYQLEQKSVLQRTSNSVRGLIYTCYICQNSFATHITPTWPDPPADP